MSALIARLRRRLTYANVTATLALMIAVSGGTALAATKLITGRQIAKSTITAANIKQHSLLAKNFKSGQLPRGATGPAGPAGATGVAGPTGVTGPAGAAGSAIAYGDLGLNGNGNPVFNSVLSAGFTTASSPSAGIYCIPYPAGVSTNLPLSISDNGNETAQWNQVANGQCNGTGYEIANVTSSSGLSGGGLNISVP